MTQVSLDEAQRLLERGNLADAEHIYNELTHDATCRSQAYYGLGLINRKRGQRDLARRCFAASVDSDPKAENSWFYLGELANESGDKSEALRMYGRTLYVNPRHSGALTRMPRLLAPAAPSTTSHAPGQANFASRPGQGGESLKPPRPPRSSSSSVGIARNVYLQAIPWNGQPGGRQSLSFRLDVVRDGSVVGAVGVEMRAFAIKGFVHEADWIEVEPLRNMQKVKSLFNLSKNIPVNTALW